jgi:hypothetical protein
MESSSLVWPFGQGNWDRLAAAIAAEASPGFQQDYGPAATDEPLAPEDEEMLF